MGFRFNARLGWAISGFYLIVALVVFCAHWVSVLTNPADSGESAIGFFLMTLPWGLWLSKFLSATADWGYWAYPVAWLCIALNALLLYLPFGCYRKPN